MLVALQRLNDEHLPTRFEADCKLARKLAQASKERTWLPHYDTMIGTRRRRKFDRPTYRVSESVRLTK